MWVSTVLTNVEGQLVILVKDAGSDLSERVYGTKAGVSKGSSAYQGTIYANVEGCVAVGLRPLNVLGILV